MKKHTLSRAPLALAVLSLFLLTLWGCPGPTPPPPPPPAPVDTIAHWSFDGTLRDITGHGHNGTPIGTVHYTQDRWNMKGRSLLLDSGASVRVHDSTDLHFTNASSYTISFWIRTKSATSAGIYSWGRADGATPGVTLSLRGGKPHVGITATPANIDLTGPNSVADNAWHLLTLTVDAPHTVKLYVDTTVVAQSNVGTLRPHEQNKGPIRIGRLADSTGQFLGMIAKGIIFNKALGPGPVKSMYLDDQSSSPPITGVCAPSSTTLFAVDNNGRALKDITGATPISFANAQQLPTSALFGVDAYDDTHAMAVGANGTIFTYDGSSWTPLSAPIPQASGVMMNIYAVKFIDSSHVLIAGGFEDGIGGRFLMLGTRPSSWPGFQWSQLVLPGVQSGTRALSTIAVKGSSATVAGWDGQLYSSTNAISSPFVAINSSDHLKHYTSFDYSTAPNGVVVTDDGYSYPVSSAGVGISTNSTPGYAYWTTAVIPAGTFVGGGIGTTQPQLSGILSKNGTPVIGVPPDHVWFSSCKIPNSTAVRIGGYEGQQINVYFGQ